ncbi:MAG: hypothetical protein EBS89_12425 [Proteobacteria bacterium]|nr:hypothetical protein [Pseudomonadota bacterium]
MQQFDNAFLCFKRDALGIYAHQYIDKKNIVVRYYINGVGQDLFALMMQAGKSKPNWSVYDPSKKKIAQRRLDERVAIDFPRERELGFHDSLIDWALSESVKNIDSRKFLIQSGYNTARYRSIDDPWEPME